jgi:hypothetical protein
MSRTLHAIGCVLVLMCVTSNVTAFPTLSAFPTKSGIMLQTKEIKFCRARSKKIQIRCSSTVSDTMPVMGLSEASSWHRGRRRAILTKYPEIQALEGREPHGAFLLLFSNALQFFLMWKCASLSIPAIIILGCTVGATLSLWQLTTLHEVIHGTCVRAGSRMQSFLMWIGSFPCVFGYFLYLQIGHLSHHNRMGAHSVADLFESNAPYFEDGDVLHATHRMRLAGPTGPKPPPALAPLFPDGRPASVALAFFEKGWREGQAIRNMLLYAASLCLERLVLIISDRVASVTGRVDFFAAKPADGFHAVATGHARLQTAFQLAVLVLLGWRPLLYLFIAETAWSLPIHPACAMYITNHGSTTLPEVRRPGLFLPHLSSLLISATYAPNKITLCPALPCVGCTRLGGRRRAEVNRLVLSGIISLLYRST